MCSSWLPSASRSHESPFEISSIIHSLAQNRPRLPGPLTFRDEPSPGRSLSNIVSRLSNSIDQDPQSPSEPNNHLKSKNEKNCSENLKTQTVVPASLSRRARVDLLISQALWNSKDPPIIKFHSKHQSMGLTHAVASADSLENSKGWDSSNLLSPKTGHPLKSTTSGSTASQLLKNPNCDGVLPQNNVKIINRRNFFLNKYSLNSLGIRGLEQVSSFSQNKVNNFVGKAEVNEFYSRASAPERRDICEVINYDSNNTLNNNNSERLVRNRIKMRPRMKSSYKVKGRRIRKISSSNLLEERGPTLKVELPTSDTRIFPKEDLQKPSEDRREEQKIIVDETLIEKPQEASIDVRNCNEALAVESREEIIDPEPPKPSKLNRIRSSFASGSFLQKQACRKPSKTAIPTITRGRALFRPLAGIKEPEISKPRLPPQKKPEKSESAVQSLQRRPENQKIISKCQNSSNSTLPSMSKLQPSQGLCKLEKAGVRIPRKSQIFRSTTFVSTEEVKKLEKKISEHDKITTNRSKSSLDSQESSKKSQKHSQSLRMLQEILSFEEKSPKSPNRTSSRIPTIKSSEQSVKASRTLFEKLAKISNSSIPSTSSGRSSKASKIPSKMIKKFQNLETQTLVPLETSQSLQTVPTTQEQSTIFTETESSPFLTDAGVSCDLDPLPSPQPVNKSRINNIISKKLVDVEISCNLNPVLPASASEEKPNDNLRHEMSSPVKILRVMETQTSRSLLLNCTEGYRNDNQGANVISLGTTKLKFPCKEINTDKCILIDSATGKDRLEIQNFCCDSQLTNTDVQSIYSPINCALTKDANHQVDPIRSLMNINLLRWGELMGNTISSTSRSCLIESCGKYSNKLIRKQEEIAEIPREVIRAFEMVEERARNLCRALEIYQHNLMKNSEMRVLNEVTVLEKDTETKVISSDLETGKELEKGESLGGKTTMKGQTFVKELKTFLMHQEIEMVVQEILKEVEREVSLKDFEKDLVRTSHGVERSPAAVLTNRGSILPIIYGALCSLVFWSLQFSMNCDFA